MRSSAGIALVIALGGCGISQSSVNDDPLTKQLGESATAVQRVGSDLANLDENTFRRFKNAKDEAAVARTNAVVEHLVKEEFGKVDIDELDDMIDNPERYYRGATRIVREFESWSGELEDSELPASSFRESPAAIAAFLGDYNAYVAFLKGAADDLTQTFQKAMELRYPTVRFLRRTRAAVRSGDYQAVRRARESFLRAMNGAVGSFGTDLEKAGLVNGAEDQKRFDRLVDHANDEEEVRALVNTVMDDYPRSLFAERFQR